MAPNQTMLRFALDDAATLPELEEHQVVELSHQAMAEQWLELSIDALVLEPFLHPGDSTWRWRWNPGAAAGIHQVRLQIGTQQRSIPLRVIPRTIDRQRYDLLLQDLQATAYDLMLLLGGGFEGATTAARIDRPRQLLSAYYTLFEQRLDLFIHAVQQIAARPRDRLRAGSETVPLGQAASLDPTAPPISYEPAPPSMAPDLQAKLRPEGGLLPRSGVQRHSRADVDTYEHRLLKRTLDLLLRRAQHVGALAEQELQRPGNLRRAAEVRRVAEGCAHAAARLRELRMLPFLQQVRELDSYHGSTALLQREAAYRDVYRTWIALRREPLIALDAPLLQIPIAELPRLYELWCALQIALVLSTTADWPLVQQQLVTDLIESEPVLRVEPGDLLAIQQGLWRIVLRYQPRYRPRAADTATPGSLDRHVRVPDLALEAHGPDGAVRMLIVDAKYRLDADQQHVPQDALAEAYAYKGAIGQHGQSCVDAAFVVYPAEAALEQYRSGVGALPLLPGADTHLRVLIDGWLAQFRQD